MVRGQVMFDISTAIVILTFLCRFQMNSAIQKNAGWTDHGPTDGPPDGRTDGQTNPHIEMRGRI